jgi:hypothetical protein
MPDHTIGFLVSPPATYKTWVTFDLAVSVAGGKPFLGKHEVGRTGPVIIVQQEDFHGQTAERLGVIIRSKHEISREKEKDGEFEFQPPPDLPIYLHPDRSLHFEQEEIIEDFKKVIAHVQPALVIIDPLYSAISTDDYMAKGAERMFVLKHLRDEFGTSFMISHHRKKSAEGNQREGLWGSQFLNAFLETGWQLSPGRGKGRIRVQRHFKASEPVPEIDLTFSIETRGTKEFSYSVSEEESANVDESSDVADFLRLDVGIKPADLARKMGRHRSTVGRYLTRAMKDGTAEEREGEWFAVELPDF